MSLATRPAHIARAALEAIALQIDDVLVAMQSDLGQPIEQISVDGSASRNDVLMQMLADLTACPVMRPKQIELSALGAARMAARGLGIDLPVAVPADATRFTPAIPVAARHTIRKQWAAAIRRTSLHC
jgi:glycerol kinase